MIRLATLSDLDYVDYLRKRESSSLGFVPKQTYEQLVSYGRYDIYRKRWLYSELLIYEENKTPVGFCYVSYSGKGNNYAHIFQIVLQPDARRFYRATKIIEHIERVSIKRGLSGIDCRVATDLESNIFWRALGFEVVGIVNSTFLNQKQSKSQRLLFLYQRQILDNQ